jgi:TM2 domain.
MPTAEKPSATPDSLEIDLREPNFAALLAWLWPGLGHIYQRRYAKGVLFMVCILGTYFFGLALGEGKVVYASWNQVERRWQFPLQLGVGLPAAPAVVQSFVVRRGGEPALFGGKFAPPRSQEELSEWHNRLNIRFELGTLYTMIAGLLNVLAIWDAFAGPVISEPASKERGPPTDDEKDKKA